MHLFKTRHVVKVQKCFVLSRAFLARARCRKLFLPPPPFDFNLKTLSDCQQSLCVFSMRI